MAKAKTKADYCVGLRESAHARAFTQQDFVLMHHCMAETIKEHNKAKETA